jgi:hypothetical protein
MFRLVLGLSIVSLGLYWDQIKTVIPHFDPSTNDSVISFSKPDDVILKKVSRTADLVTDKNDRDSLGIFNWVFSKRIESYDLDSQQVNDIYVGAAKEVYGDSLRGKYEGYKQDITNLMKDTLGTENHSVTDEEKTKLKVDFSGLAYSLVS